MTDGQLSALMYFVAALPAPPLVAPQQLMTLEPPAEGLSPPTNYDYADDWARGLNVFRSVGCASCHTPSVVLRSPVLRLPRPGGGDDLQLDLSAIEGQPLLYDPFLQGFPVWAFSDFKRHDLGEDNAALHPEEDGVPAREYLTRRLWGVANASPYFYDGRSPSLEDAILRHGGEASAAREQYLALPVPHQADLRVFLMGLRQHRHVVVP
jgi:CxxC motif-containing protein (DUF1111 family)